MNNVKMNLLIITQRVDINDDNLGFFHGWLEKFSERLERVFVICLWQGEYNLPQNVQVFSMGKEKGFVKIGQWILLKKHLLEILPKVDGVFFHMCPIYAVASFPLVRFFNKRTMLWFVHKSVNWKLKLASRLVDKIFTASEESCRLRDRKKIKIVGHGIDVEKFQIPRLRQGFGGQANSKFRILSVGRIAPVKDQETLIRAIDILVHQKNIKDFEVKIIGSPLEENEKKYFEQLKKLKEAKGLDDYIEFLGSVSYAKMPAHYQEADLFINLSHTGSMDKVVLEAMASGCLVLTCNEAFETILDRKYLFQKKDPQNLAEKILGLRGAERDQNLREIVIKEHNLDNLIDKIILEFNVLNKRI